MGARSGGTWILLALRFLLEIALLAALAVVAVRALGGVVGWLVGVAVAVVVAVVWGVLLSPRRRAQAPLGVRVLVEMLLFLAAAVGLAVTGLVGLGVALLAAEVVVVAWLWALGLPPGTDLEA
ncbi:MAG TPA: DUF2568 domain-containing protein [Candidatus Nanopelagicales bacterium]|nr:DUF2568 domain-containing protein [Candidatus Nanopelagicales bacterium]